MRKSINVFVIVSAVAVLLFAAGMASAENTDTSKMLVASMKDKVGHQYRLVKPEALAGVIFDRVECVTTEGKRVCFGNNVMVMSAHENFTVMDMLVAERSDEMVEQTTLYKIRFSRSDRVGYMTVTSFDASLRSQAIVFIR